MPLLFPDANIKQFLMKILYTIALVVISSGIVRSQQTPNTLNENETKEGWKLLFDGKSTKGWRTFNTTKAGSAWKVQNGELYLDKTVKDGRGDLLTDAQFENYEFSIEWKIDSCGNSGIIFNVVEGAKYEATYVTGPEMQVLDNACHPDAKIIKHRAGDLYDLISSSKETARPAGQWNHAVIRSDHDRMQF